MAIKKKAAATKKVTAVKSAKKTIAPPKKKIPSVKKISKAPERLLTAEGWRRIKLRERASAKKKTSK